MVTLKIDERSYSIEEKMWDNACECALDGDSMKEIMRKCDVCDDIAAWAQLEMQYDIELKRINSLPVWIDRENWVIVNCKKRKLHDVDCEEVDIDNNYGMKTIEGYDNIEDIIGEQQSIDCKGIMKIDALILKGNKYHPVWFVDYKKYEEKENGNGC